MPRNIRAASLVTQSGVRSEGVRSRPKTVVALLALLALLLGSALGCAPKVSRGGAGTKNPGLDDAALSTGLDKVDLDYLVEENLNALFDSNFWQRSILDRPDDQPLVTIFPIRNDTSEHLGDQLDTLLSSIETFLVNSGSVGVVSRERQAEMMREVRYQQSGDIDPASAALIGRQLGAKYYFTGKVGAVDERLQKERRVQYSLFLQVIEVDTSLIRFQNETARSKAIKR
ncbi:MAG: penicillin-binding protein activator LpoB [Deltaproteobacteria bacterium]|nr:penicillin-binding protein activator LpoB [Deltaproteobacteria bacterium]MBW2292587.1 penicillin-binding protein activator LpoB [Deltaproteobacteria bacterium]